MWWNGDGTLGYANPARVAILWQPTRAAAGAIGHAANHYSLKPGPRADS